MAAEKITAEQRTEFGKGAARRIRREDKIPAVLYGHGDDPLHLTLPGHDTMMALKHGGANALLDLQIDGKSQLALTKQVQVDPITPRHRARRLRLGEARREGHRRRPDPRGRRRRPRDAGRHRELDRLRSRPRPPTSPSSSRSPSRAPRSAPRSTPPTSTCPPAPRCWPTRSCSSSTSPSRCPRRRSRPSSRRPRPRPASSARSPTRRPRAPRARPPRVRRGRRRGRLRRGCRGLLARSDRRRRLAGRRAGQSRPGVRRPPAQRRLPRRRRAGLAGWARRSARTSRAAPTSSRDGSGRRARPDPGVVLARPRGYMNESGGPVKALATFYKVAPPTDRGDPRRARHPVRDAAGQARRRRQRPQRAAVDALLARHR